jgi:hypothetical protein
LPNPALWLRRANRPPPTRTPSSDAKSRSRSRADFPRRFSQSSRNFAQCFARCFARSPAAGLGKPSGCSAHFGPRVERW